MTDERSTPNPDLDDVIGDALMGDDGEIHLPDESSADEPSAEPAQEREEQPEGDTSEPAADEPPQPEHNWEKRYNDLLPEFTRRSQELAELKKDVIPGLQQQIDQIRAGQTRPEQESSDDAVDVPNNLIEAMQDPETGAQLIMQLADSVVEQRLGAFVERVAPMLEDYEIEQELRDVALAPGNEDFFELLPTVRQIIARSEREVSFADALNIARTFSGVDGKTTSEPDEAGDAARPKQQKVSAEEIAQAAARHEPETGVAGEVQPPTDEVGSVEDAVEAALGEIYG